jgi:hypothetical protein
VAHQTQQPPRTTVHLVLLARIRPHVTPPRAPSPLRKRLIPRCVPLPVLVAQRRRRRRKGRLQRHPHALSAYGGLCRHARRFDRVRVRVWDRPSDGRWVYGRWWKRKRWWRRYVRSRAQSGRLRPRCRRTRRRGSCLDRCPFALVHIKTLPPSLVRRNRRRIPQRRRNGSPTALFFLHRHHGRDRRRRPIPHRRSQRQLDRTLPLALTDLSPILTHRPCMASSHPTIHFPFTRHIHRFCLVHPALTLTLALVLARHVRDDAHQALTLSVLVDVPVAEVSSRVLLGL